MIVGKTKDVAKGFPVAQFVGLKSKIYLHMKKDDTAYKKTKEIIKDVIKV